VEGWLGTGGLSSPPASAISSCIVRPSHQLLVWRWWQAVRPLNYTKEVSICHVNMKHEEIYAACILALLISSFHCQALGIPLALAVPLFLVFMGIFWFQF
jgi:hypothetical protein